MGNGMWYFAHPYTRKVWRNGWEYCHAAEEANFRLCNFRAGELIKRGYNVFSPISHSHPIHIATPDFLANDEHEMWYRLDNELIERVRWSGIILAPDWKCSKGCVAERDLFKARRLPIRYFNCIIRERVVYRS